MKRILLTSLEIKHLTDELQFLSGGTIDGIFHKDKDIAMKIIAKGKGYNLFASPDMICLTDRERIKDITEFAMMLRKYMKGKKIVGIKQHVFDRIFEIWTENNILIFEMDNPNCILCDRTLKIITPMEFQKFENRNITAGVNYTYPKSIDIRDVNNLEKIMHSEETVIKLLENFFSGYASDILTLAKISQGKVAKELTEAEIKRLKDVINFLVYSNRKPQIIYNGDNAEVLLFDLETRKAERKRYFNSFVEALGYLITKEEEIENVRKAERKRIKKHRKHKMKKMLRKKGKL